MSSAFSSTNPVILFGDVGPEVVKLSQIYDPDNDEYSLSKDELAVAGKVYYTRSYTNKTVYFNKVSTVHVGVDTPEANDWYEANLGGSPATGKYVPAEKSLVVVDFMTEEYNERTILIVESVDEITLKSKLVPHNCGADGSVTARSLQYGNGDYQLYFEAETDPTTNVKLTPDRKLMLYGNRYYMYKLVRNGYVISTPTPEVTAVSTNALVPFVGPSATKVTISGDLNAENYYGKYSGSEFDTLNGIRFNSIVIPEAPADPTTDSHQFVPTFDAVYQSGLAYYLFTAAHFELSSDVVYKAGTDYYLKSSTEPAVYTKIESPIIGEDIPGEVYVHVSDKWERIQECVFVLTNDVTKKTKTYFKREDMTGKLLEVEVTAGQNPKALGYYEQSTIVDPATASKYYFSAGTTVNFVINGTTGAYMDFAAVRIQQSANVAFGTGRTGYLNKDDESHVYYPGTGYLKRGFSIQAGESVDMEVYELRENSASLRLVMNVTLTTKESTVLDGTDTTSKKMTKFDVELEDNEDPNFWLMKQEETVSDLVKRMLPKVYFDDGSITSLDIKDPGLFIYGLDNISTAVIGKEYPVLFKYFPGKNATDSKFPYINSNTSKGFVTVTKILKVANLGAVTIRKVSVIPVWNNTSAVYDFKYLVYDKTCNSPLFVNNLGTVLTEQEGRSAALTNDHYLDDRGTIRPTDDPGGMLGYIQHATIALYAKADGYKSSVYDQEIAILLRNWTENKVAAKWLIGDDTSAYDAALMPYGNPYNGIRPYIEFSGVDYATDPTESKPFKIGGKFHKESDTTPFLESFYHNSNPPGPDVGSLGATTQDPNYCAVRTLMTRDDYTCLQNANEELDLALEGVDYYDVGTKKKVNTKVGVTNVSEYMVKKVADQPLYTKTPAGEYIDGEVEDGTWIYPDIGGDREAGRLYRTDYYTKNTAEIKSGYLRIDGTGTERYFDPFRLLGTYTADTAGGATPFVFGSNYNTQCMGIAVVEFVRLETGASSVYKHLYGVPVEVRFPYEPTADVKYKVGKKYFVYGYEHGVKTSADPKNMFYQLTENVDYTVGDDIDNSVLARWEIY